MSEYLLMNKDTKLVLFTVSDEMEYGEYEISEVERYVDESRLPVKYVDISTWVDNRDYAKHKEHLQEWLHEWQIDNALGFIDITHCLGLNDSLWVKKADSDLTWDKVNLYKNEFSDVVAHTAFDKGLHGLKLKTTSPEFTSDGSFAKCWIQEDDGIYLYKRSSTGFANAGKEAYSEYYATQYSKTICSDYVPYDLVMFKDSLVSKCKMFTSENEGFVQIYKYFEADKKYSMKDVLTFLEPYGFEDDFRRMIVLDSIILNVDRHFGNFGFIVDNETFEIKRFAPVFDNNKSMLARAMPSDLVDDSPYIQGLSHCIGGDFVRVGKAMMTDAIRDDVRELVDIPMTLHEKYNLDPERTDFLDKIVQKQIRGVLGEE